MFRNGLLALLLVEGVFSLWMGEMSAFASVLGQTGVSQSAVWLVAIGAISIAAGILLTGSGFKTIGYTLEVAVIVTCGVFVVGGVRAIFDSYATFLQRDVTAQSIAALALQVVLDLAILGFGLFIVGRMLEDAFTPSGEPADDGPIFGVPVPVTDALGRPVTPHAADGMPVRPTQAQSGGEPHGA
jgi:hypothetical protein